MEGVRRTREIFWGEKAQHGLGIVAIVSRISSQHRLFCIITVFEILGRKEESVWPADLHGRNALLGEGVEGVVREDSLVPAHRPPEHLPRLGAGPKGP